MTPQEIITEKKKKLDANDNWTSSASLRKEWRREQQKDGRVIPIYLVVSGTDRHYGGPEEGGWWYNNTVILEVYKVWDIPNALRCYRKLKDEYEQPRYGIYSAANRGEAEYSIDLYSDPSFFAELENIGRPTYC